MNITNSFLGTGGTLVAAGGDISLSNHILAITGCPQMDYRKIENCGGFLASVAQVLQVTTVTPVAANNAFYKLIITQYVQATGKYETTPLFYTSAASGDTATTICNALRTQLASYLNVKVTGSGAATLILTAVTRNPIFTVTLVSLGGGLTQVLTTPGVASRGTVADLTEAGITGGVAGQVYSQVQFTYGVVATGIAGVGIEVQLNQHTLFVNEAAADFADFATRMDEVIGATIVGSTTVADPETVSLGS